MGSILIVDDDAAIHSMYQRTMRPLGHSIIKALEPMEALKIMVEQGVDLIILDQKMPGMTGLEFLKFLRERGKPVPVILVSGHITNELLQQCNALKVSYIFRKPVSSETLLATAGKILDSIESERLHQEACEQDSSQEKPFQEEVLPESPPSSARVAKGLSKFGRQALDCLAQIGVRLGLSPGPEAEKDSGIEIDPEHPEMEPEKLEQRIDSFFRSQALEESPVCDEIVQALQPALIPENGTFRIWVTEDGLCANLDLVPPKNGGYCVTETKIREKLAALHVIYGIQDQEIQRVLMEQALPDIDPSGLRGVCIARGLPPRHGQDGFIEYPPQNRMHDQESRSKARSLERIDYREQHRICNVAAGEKIAVISMPTRGSSGISVHGMAIGARDGQPVRMQCGSNVKLSADGRSMHSLIDGHLVVKGLFVQVEKVYHVAGDVDMSVGNIHFKGDVIIDGCILDDFAVEATGSVIVGRNINAATVMAGGNVSVGKGIICRNKGSITAMGSVRALFVENSEIHAMGNVMVGANAMHTTIFTNGGISVSGKIMGGHLQARNWISAGEIGSAFGKMPEITVGVDLENQIFCRRIQEELGRRQEQLVHVRQFLTRAREIYQGQGGMSEADKVVVFKLLEKYEKLQVEIQSLKDDYAARAMQDAPTGTIDCFVQARDELCGGLEINFGSRHHKVERALDKTRLRLDEELLEVVSGPWEKLTPEQEQGQQPETGGNRVDFDIPLSMNEGTMAAPEKKSEEDLFFDL